MTNVVAFLAGAYGIGVVAIVLFRWTTHARLTRALRKLESLHES